MRHASLVLASLLIGLGAAGAGQAACYKICPPSGAGYWYCTDPNETPPEEPIVCPIPKPGSSPGQQSGGHQESAANEARRTQASEAQPRDDAR